MAVLFTYPTKTNLASGDLVLISDSEDSNKTNNATISAVKDAIDVVDSIVAGSGISVSSATGNVTISTPAYSGGGNIGHVPTGGTSSNFLRGDGTWNTATIPLAADGTRGGIQIGYAENAKNYPVELSNEKAFVNVPWTDTDTTYSLGASSPGSNDIKVSLDASGSATDSEIAIISSDSSISLAMNNNKVDITAAAPGGVSSFTNSNGTFISAGTANSAATGAVTMGTIDLSATGTKDITTFLRGDNTWNVPTFPIEGFNTFSIYSASFEISNVSPAAGRTIIRQSVCETECTIGFVDFMRLAGKDPISVFIYSGTISSPSSASLKLSGSQAAPVATPTANSINTIQFKDASLNPQTYKFSAGESIVIVVSLAPGTVSAGGVSIAGGKDMISNAAISRTNNFFMVPDGFDNPSPPGNDLESFLEDTGAENPTTEGIALHFYNLP